MQMESPETITAKYDELAMATDEVLAEWESSRMSFKNRIHSSWMKKPRISHQDLCWEMYCLAQTEHIKALKRMDFLIESYVNLKAKRGADAEERVLRSAYQLKPKKQRPFVMDTESEFIEKLDRVKLEIDFLKRYTDPYGATP